MAQLVPKIVVDNRAKLFIPSVVSTIVVALILMYADLQYALKDLPMGMVSFEMLFTKDKFNQVITQWNVHQKSWVYFSLYFDYVFMITYCLAIVTGVLWRANASEISLKIADLVVIGTLFDVMENVGLISIMMDPVGTASSTPFLVGCCATVKFALVFLGIGFFIKPFGPRPRVANLRPD